MPNPEQYETADYRYTTYRPFHDQRGTVTVWQRRGKSGQWAKACIDWTQAARYSSNNAAEMITALISAQQVCNWWNDGVMEAPGETS
jgi:hypothetical protein